MPKDGGGRNGPPSLFLWIPSSFPLFFIFLFYLFPRPALMCLPKPLQVPFLNSFFFHFLPPFQPLVCSLCAAFSYLFNLLPIVTLFCLHRSRRPSCRGMALLSYNLDNAGCCLCSSFFFLLSVETCVCLTLRDRYERGGWGGTWRSTNLLRHMGQTSRGREDECKSGKNKIKYVFVEHGSKWSRNNLIGPSKIRLGFQGLPICGGEK